VGGTEGVPPPEDGGSRQGKGDGGISGIDIVRPIVSTGMPFRHSRESGNQSTISREFPGSRELIFTS
jgi:hypothetical protein